MIRNDLYKSIIETIKKDNYFTEHDFSILTNSINNGVNLSIKCNFDDKYILNVNILNTRENINNGAKDFVIRGKRSPGSLSLTEEIIHIGRDSFINGIAEWTGFIKEEMLSIPIYRKLEEQRVEIDKLDDWIEKAPDEFFSQREAAELRHKLDDLEKRFAAHWASEIKNKQEVEDKLQDLHSEIEVLKTQIEVLRQPKWWSSLFGRIIKWSADPNNQKLISSTTEVAKLLLPSSASEAAASNNE